MKPQPVTKVVVCSVCDMDWGLHGPDPVLMDCIRLLKQYRTHPWTWTHQYPQPGIRYYGNTRSLEGVGTINTTNTMGATMEYKTPKEN